MKVTIKGSTKAEIAKKIEKKFKGIVTVKAAKKMVKGMKNEKKIEVKTPKWFRFRDAKGHFVKMGK
jgi:hypothetical protein